MKLSDLAALVTVRNHILTVINDKSVTEKGEHKYLNKVRLELDKKFVSIMKSYAKAEDDKIVADVDSLFPNELLLVKVGGNGYSPSQKDLEQWREIFEEAQYNKDFKIFTHDAISVTQLEVDASAQVRVRPTVEPRSIEVSPNIVRTSKGQLTLPLDNVNESISVEKADENLAEQNVKLTPAVVEDAVKPIKAPEEKKQKALLSMEEAAEKTTKADPEVEEKLKKAKAELAKQGRKTKKSKSDDEAG